MQDGQGPTDKKSEMGFILIGQGGRSITVDKNKCIR